MASTGGRARWGTTRPPHPLPTVHHARRPLPTTPTTPTTPTALPPRPCSDKVPSVRTAAEAASEAFSNMVSPYSVEELLAHLFESMAQVRAGVLGKGAGRSLLWGGPSHRPRVGCQPHAASAALPRRLAPRHPQPPTCKGPSRALAQAPPPAHPRCAHPTFPHSLRTCSPRAGRPRWAR